MRQSLQTNHRSRDLLQRDIDFSFHVHIFELVPTDLFSKFRLVDLQHRSSRRPRVRTQFGFTAHRSRAVALETRVFTNIHKFRNQNYKTTLYKSFCSRCCIKKNDKPASRKLQIPTQNYRHPIYCLVFPCARLVSLYRASFSFRLNSKKWYAALLVRFSIQRIKCRRMEEQNICICIIFKKQFTVHQTH